MKTVNCHRKYPITTNFLDTMLEHSVNIQEGETKLDAFRRGLKELDQIASELRKEANPHLYPDLSWTKQDGKETLVSREKEVIAAFNNQPEERKIGILLADIYSCESIKVLESYRLIAKLKPELQAAYNQQFEKLSKSEAK